MMLEVAREVRDAVYALGTAHRKSVTVAGIKLTLDNASPRMRYVMSRGYETEDAVLASKVLNESDVVLEAGSATGFLALHCLTRVRVRGYCMVEANAGMLDVIHKNFELNGVRMPALVHAAVAAEDGEISFGVNRNFWSSSTVARKGETRVLVPARSIPSLCAGMSEPPSALIMDIEGGEAQIPPQEFGRFRKIVMETHPKLVGQDVIDRLLASLAASGFTIVDRIGGSYAFVRA